MGIHAQFALVNRRVIADEIERLIALLDIADGDCDLEDDDPDDDQLDRGELEEGVLGIPLYAVDQTTAPINERSALHAYNLAQWGRS